LGARRALHCHDNDLAAYRCARIVSCTPFAALWLCAQRLGPLQALTLKVAGMWLLFYMQAMLPHHQRASRPAAAHLLLREGSVTLFARECRCCLGMLTAIFLPRLMQCNKAYPAKAITAICLILQADFRVRSDAVNCVSEYLC